MLDYYKSEEFLATLSRYQDSLRDGVSCYLDSDEVINLCNYFLDKDQPENSFEVLDLGLRLHPDNAAIHVAIVSTLIFTAKYEEAREELGKVEKMAESQDIDIQYLEAQLICAIDNDATMADKLFSDWYEMVSKDIKEEGKFNMIGYEDNPDAMLRNAMNLVILSFTDLMKKPEDEFIRKWINKYIDNFSPLGRYDEDMVLANVCNTMEYFDLIERVYSMLLEENPYLQQGFTILGAAQQINGKTDDAIDSLEFALAINPEDVQANITMAHCLFLKHNYEKALTFFQKYQSMVNSDNESYYIGLCLLYQNKIDEALEYFQKEYKLLTAIPADDDSASRFVSLADAFFSCSCYAVSFDLLTRIAGHADDNIDFHLLKGYLYLIADDFENGTNCFKVAVDLAEDVREMVIVLSSRLISLNFNEMAHYYLSAVVDSIDVEPHKLFYYNAYAFLSLAQYNLLMIDEALDSLKIACEMVPDTVKQIWGDLPDSLPPQDYYDYLSDIIKNSNNTY